MMNQSLGPASPGSTNSLQAGDILYFMRVTLFISLLCMGYSLSRPKIARGKEQYLRLSASPAVGSENREPAGIVSWQKQASEKAIEKYTTTQGKQWQRWNEAMFERSD